MPRECWESFATPEIIHYYGNTIRLEYHCKTANKTLRVYYDEPEQITAGFISDVICTAVAVCAHCTAWQSLSDNEGNAS